MSTDAPLMRCVWFTWGGWWSSLERVNYALKRKGGEEEEQTHQLLSGGESLSDSGGKSEERGIRDSFHVGVTQHHHITYINKFSRTVTELKI